MVARDLHASIPLSLAAAEAWSPGAPLAPLVPLLLAGAAWEEVGINLFDLIQMARVLRAALATPPTTADGLKELVMWASAAPPEESTRRFYGQRIPAAQRTASIPLEYGVERLCIELPGELACVPFEPWGALYFSDWRFEGVFSPDGQWALLQQDRFCPYTVIAVPELGPVLRGERPPDFTFGVELAPVRLATSSLAPVCEDARWEGDDAVVFTASVHSEEAEARWERPLVPPVALRPTPPSLRP